MTKLLLRTGVHPEELVLQAAQPLAHVQCCCRLQVCAGSDRVVQQASLGSMVKAQKSTGRKSTHCLRREVLKKTTTVWMFLSSLTAFTVTLWKTHLLYVKTQLDPVCHFNNCHQVKVTFYSPRVSGENLMLS